MTMYEATPGQERMERSRTTVAPSQYDYRLKVPEGLGDLRGLPVPAERVSAMSSVIQAANALDSLANEVAQRAMHMESRLLGSVPRTTGAGNAKEPEPPTLFADLEARLRRAARTLDDTLVVIDRLQKELCD